MLEYSLDEAEALLNKNYEAAIKSLNQVDEDLSFLREQLTTLEVSILLTNINQSKSIYEIYRSQSLCQYYLHFCRLIAPVLYIF